MADFKLIVLISGGGTNLQAIIDATQSGALNVKIAQVICDNDDAYGINRAKKAGIPVSVISAEHFDSRRRFDEALKIEIEAINPDLIVLAGFMRILGQDFVTQYQGRIINIHPSLLPEHKGLNTHQRAIDAGDQIHGATVHFVTEQLDDGPMIIQAEVKVLTDDSAVSLQARVLEQEHRIYPKAIQMIADGQIQYNARDRC